MSPKHAVFSSEKLAASPRRLNGRPCYQNPNWWRVVQSELQRRSRPGCPREKSGASLGLPMGGGSEDAEMRTRPISGLSVKVLRREPFPGENSAHAGSLAFWRPVTRPWYPTSHDLPTSTPGSLDICGARRATDLGRKKIPHEIVIAKIRGPAGLRLAAPTPGFHSATFQAHEHALGSECLKPLSIATTVL